MGIFILKKIPQTQEEFQSGNTPNGTVMMDPRHHTLVHTHRTYITKSRPCCETWEDSPSQCRFTNYRSEIKAPLWWGLWTVGRLCMCGGREWKGNSALALNLAVNLKLLPQNFVLKIQPRSLLRIYVLLFTCQISITSLKKKQKKKKQKDSPTHQILKTIAYQENHWSGVRRHFFFASYHSVFSLLILKSFFAYMGFPGGASGKEPTCQCRRHKRHGLGRSPGEGHDNPLQYSCLLLLLLLLLGRFRVSDSVQPHGRQPTRLPCPWDSPSKNTGVGCHCLLPSCLENPKDKGV